MPGPLLWPLPRQDPGAVQGVCRVQAATAAAPQRILAGALGEPWRGVPAGLGPGRGSQGKSRYRQSRAPGHGSPGPHWALLGLAVG